MDILIIEDEGLIRNLLVEVLEEEGYHVVGAANGEVALKTLRTANSPPRLIILDLNMPVMNGWQFRSAQQHEATLAAIPVIILSAGRNIAQETKTLAAVDYLTKPLDLTVLLDRIKIYCPLSEA
jgi:DNA-binding response OmpR family regulator